ncbi:MAG: TolC family protein [Oscillospiraceae bacterium]|nr:TolC family protein [Oscillospiraceae bacterium]
MRKQVSLKKQVVLKKLCVILCVFQLTAFVNIASVVSSVSAPTILKNFHMAQAQRLALASSPEQRKIYNEILLKRMKYTESVKGIQAKAKNKQTLRWTPLLSFKFPEKLDYPEEIELVMKPLALTAEINTLQHKMNDQRFAIVARVNTTFFKVYVLQEKVRFTEDILAAAELELDRNIARLATGTAKQSDIDNMQKSVDKLIGDLAQLKRNFQTEKEELSDLIRLDVTTGYYFAPPLQTAEISRQQLEFIIKYTLDNDQLYYEMKLAESMALVNLNTTEQLFRKQYGAKVNPVNPFLVAARQGNEIDGAAFKIQYDAMLKTFDKPWDGQYRILFIRFTKEFLKGQISGTRYIEDEMYALYTACMEYAAARKDREATEKALIKQVNSEFEALVTAKNAAASLVKAVEDEKTQLERVIALNKTGKAEYSEVKDKQDEYQSAQVDAIDALAAYNDLLTSFDRLTCGAITKLLRGDGLDTDTGGGGVSLPGDGEGNIYYYIYNDIADMTFVFGLDVPDDFEPEITHFELWYEGVQIGTRTAVGNRLKHLALTIGSSDEVTVRVFDGDKFVAECVVDATSPRDILPIPKAEKPNEIPTEKVIGTYKIETVVTGSISTSKLTFVFDTGLGAGFYRIVYGESDVYSSDLIPVDEGFTYLSLLFGSLSDITVLIYDKNQQPLGEAWLDPSEMTVRQLIVNDE